MVRIKGINFNAARFKKRMGPNNDKSIKVLFQIFRDLLDNTDGEDPLFSVNPNQFEDMEDDELDV